MTKFKEYVEWIRRQDAARLRRLWPHTVSALAGFTVAATLVRVPAEESFGLVLVWGAGPLLFALFCGIGVGLSVRIRKKVKT